MHVDIVAGAVEPPGRRESRAIGAQTGRSQGTEGPPLRQCIGEPGPGHGSTQVTHFSVLLS